MGNKQVLQDIIDSCQRRFNQGLSAHWKNSDFNNLSQEIFRDTNVSISPSTLKRIFGKVTVDQDYIPQQATLDALKKYGRYLDEEDAEQAQPHLQSPHSTNKKINLTQLKVALPVLIITAAVVTMLVWWFGRTNNITGHIKLMRTEGQLPATAVFDLQFSETADSLFINFGDKSPVFYVKPGEKIAAHIYYFPGVFTVSFQTRKQVIATVNASIQSNGWIGFACHRQDDIPVRFFAFPVIKNSSDSLFAVTNNQLFKNGLDTTGPILTRLSNYTPVTGNADDFIFETTFKNSLPEKGVFCRSTQFQISGSNSVIRFRWVNAGCSQRVLNIVSEQIFKGATNDLSQFVLNLSQWTSVKLVNHNKQISLFVNGKQIFIGSYQQSLGDMKGLFLEFEGTGVIKTCDLKSYDGKLLYHF